MDSESVDKSRKVIGVIATIIAWIGGISIAAIILVAILKLFGTSLFGLTVGTLWGLFKVCVVVYIILLLLKWILLLPYNILCKKEEKASRKEAEEEEKAEFAEWCNDINEWCTRLDKISPTMENISTVLSLGGTFEDYVSLRGRHLIGFRGATPLHFDGKYFRYDNGKVRGPLLEKMDSWFGVALKNFYANLEKTLASCSNMQETSDEFSNCKSTLHEWGHTEYCKAYRGAALASITTKTSDKIITAIQGKLVPVKVNDVLVYNKKCYLYNIVSDTDKWFICENEIIIVGQRTKSSPIMRIVNLSYDADEKQLELKVLASTNSYEVYLQGGEKAQFAEYVIKAIQAKRMNATN